MRRPAQHHRPGPAAPGWTRPYTGMQSLAVFYNGDPATPPAPAPSPADLAARTPQPPAPTAAPPAPRGTDDTQVLLDKDTGQPMTQGRFSQIMTRQYDKSRHSAFREMAEAAGLDYDPATFDPKLFGQLLKEAETARQQQLTEEQRRTEELARREQALEARQAELAAKEKAAADRDREIRIRQALVTLGATGADLEDAAALMRIADDATDDDITKAAEELKGRRAEMFGTTPAPQTLPPAPSGGPAGGNAPRQPASTKDAIHKAARERAQRMGLRTDDAA